MSDYTPTTNEIEKAFACGQNGLWKHDRIMEFSRWLAEVKAQAWAEGAKQGFMAPRKGAIIVNPYKTREN